MRCLACAVGSQLEGLFYTVGNICCVGSTEPSLGSQSADAGQGYAGELVTGPVLGLGIFHSCTPIPIPIFIREKPGTRDTWIGSLEPEMPGTRVGLVVTPVGLNE